MRKISNIYEEIILDYEKDKKKSTEFNEIKVKNLADLYLNKGKFPSSSLNIFNQN